MTTQRRDPIRPPVLLVDDHPPNLLALEALLEPLDVEPVRAASGEEALRHVAARDFALVLLDVQMPGLDGIETARRMRAASDGDPLPILFVTAIDTDPARVAAGYAAGAVDYLPKPVDPHALRAKVHTFAALYRARRQAEHAARLVADAAVREAELRAQVEAAAALRALNAELERQQEEAQTLNEELELANEELQDANLALAEARDAAEHARRMQTALLDSTVEGIYGIDALGRCTFINRAAQRMLGLSPAECMGLEMHDLIHHTRADGTPYPRYACPIKAAAREGRAVRMDNELLWRRDGTSFPAEYAASPVVENGEVLGAVVTLTDVTRRRAAEAERERLLAAAHAEREQLLRIFESAPAVMAIYSGPEHLVTRVNPTWERTVGKPDALGRPFRDVFPEFRDTGLPEILDRVYRTGEAFAHPEVNVPLERFGSGELEDTYWNLVWLPVPTPHGYDILVHAVETTEQVRARREVERQAAALRAKSEEADAARRAAEAASQAKSEFLANMSHEIRTPINAVMGYTDLLEVGVAGEVNAQQREFLERIKGSSRHLLGLVNDVLDLAKVEAGRMSVGRDRAALAPAAEAALALVLPQATEKGITVEDGLDAGGALEYVGDEDRVRQILLNLLSNAVKFTDPGGRVALHAERTDTPARDAHLAGTGPWTCVRVADTGAGIAPDKLEAVFHPFVQGEAGHTKTQGGTGLGLTISREFARLMGGDLTVASQPGAGATFTLWLPAPGAAASPARGDDAGEGLARAGTALATAVEPVLAAYVARLRADERVPAAGCSRVELEDHMSALLADLAQTLLIVGETGGQADLIRDGSDLRHLVAERHGRQRVRLGWTEAALRREYGILREEVFAAVGRALPAGAASTGAAAEVLALLLDESEEISLQGMRAADDTDGLVARTRGLIQTTRRTIERVKDSVLGDDDGGAAGSAPRGAGPHW